MIEQNRSLSREQYLEPRDDIRQQKNIVQQHTCPFHKTFDTWILGNISAYQLHRPLAAQSRALQHSAPANTIVSCPSILYFCKGGNDFINLIIVREFITWISRLFINHVREEIKPQKYHVVGYWYSCRETKVTQVYVSRWQTCTI